MLSAPGMMTKTPGRGTPQTGGGTDPPSNCDTNA